MVLIQDIALKAGVSRNTVSKVLNNKPGVSDELREKILELAYQMGYKKINTDFRPNSYQEPISISVLVTNPEFSPFWVQMINSIANRLHQLDINFVYHCIRYQQEESFKLPLIIREKKIEGIIVINVYEEEIIQEIAQSGLPIVYYDIPFDKACKQVNGDVLLLEGMRSIREITEHISTQGVEEIGFIGDINYSTTIYERWLGYRAGMLHNQLPIQKEYCITKGGKRHLYDKKELEEALKGLKTLPKAFVCANDELAYMAMKVLHQKHGKPQILLSGYDNIHRALEQPNTLTTVAVDVEYVGRRLVSLLLERIQEIDKPFEVIRIETTPIFRESTNKNDVWGKVK